MSSALTTIMVSELSQSLEQALSYYSLFANRAFCISMLKPYLISNPLSNHQEQVKVTSSPIQSKINELKSLYKPQSFQSS